MSEIKSGNLIKKYRSMLNISQKEIAGSSMSHSMISLIESGKIQLTTVTAMILSDNLNKIAAKKGIELNLTLKDLLVCNKDEIENECKQRLSDIKSIMEINELNEIFQLAKENNLFNIMSEVKIVNARLYEKDYYYEEAIKKYFEALNYCEFTKNKKESVQVLVNIASCYNRLQKYNEAENYINKMKQQLSSNNIDSKLQFRATSELLYAMINNCKVSEAKKKIEVLLKDKSLKNEERKDILILKANISLNEKRYAEAIEIYSNLINEGFMEDYMIYHNLSIALILSGKVKEANLYSSSCVNTIFKEQSKENTRIFLTLVSDFYRHDIQEYSIIYYEAAIENSSLFFQYDLLSKCYIDLFKIYSSRLAIEDFAKYVDAIRLLVSEKSNVDKIFPYTLILIRYYISTNKINEINDLLNILESIKEEV